MVRLNAPAVATADKAQNLFLIFVSYVLEIDDRLFSAENSRTFDPEVVAVGRCQGSTGEQISVMLQCLVAQCLYNINLALQDQVKSFARTSSRLPGR